MTMIKDKITLNSDDLLDLYGQNNENINLITNFFSNVNIVTRGTNLFIEGDVDNVSCFKDFFGIMNQELSRRGVLSKNDVKILLSNFPSHIKPSDNIILMSQNGVKIRAKTVNQNRMVTESENNKLLFVFGPAGTGKTFTAVALAVRALMAQEVKKIVLTRPAVETGENLGFLPGDLSDKMSPYMRPLYDALNAMLSKGQLNKYINDGQIEIAPLAFMRGRTLDRSFVILDEAQNTTVEQMHMFLTRMGITSQFIVCGDISQIDLPKHQHSGLLHANSILKNVNGISFVKLEERDVVRHELVKKIIKAYKKNNNE